jgi:peptide/nickel transport system permease protein
MLNAENKSTVTRIKSDGGSSLKRILRFMGFRVFMLLITVVIGVYATIMIANMGGYVDTIMRNSIRESAIMKVAVMTANKAVAPEARQEMVSELIRLDEKRMGLDTPFLIRSFRYLENGLKLDLGRAKNMTSDSGSRTVRLILLERLPATLLLMGSSQLFLFFISVFLALTLSRSYGSFWDKAVIALSPTSAAPPWFYGIFFILIFAAFLKILPFGGMVDSPPPTTTGAYILDVLKHLILPGSSLVISYLFLSIYNWRTFFLIYSSEDYVDMAKAKGLTPREIERRYILRPTMPTIITNFALLIISLWTGATITETIFLWPGLGRTIFRAIGLYDTAVIVGSTIIFAYLLAITVFILDFVYVIVDPRVKIGGGSNQ